MQLPGEGRLLLQTAAGGQRRVESLTQILLRAAPCLLAAVEQAQPVFRHVQAVIRFMADQHDSRTGRHVAIVGYVDQHLRTNAILNPAMKNGDRIAQRSCPDRLAPPRARKF